MSGSGEMTSPSQLIEARIEELDDWRGSVLSLLRTVIRQADPEAAEEWKWVKPTSGGTAVWSHQGGIRTGEVYRSVVKVTFYVAPRWTIRPASSTPASAARSGAQSFSRGRQRRRGSPEGARSRRGFLNVS
jgi:hypothetical protein